MKSIFSRLFIVLFLGIASCKKGGSDQEIPGPAIKQNHFLDGAKKYYKAQQDAFSLLLSSPRITESIQAFENIKLTPRWSQSYVSKTARYEFVEVPVVNLKKRIVLYKTPGAFSNQISDQAQLKAAFQRILIYKNKKSNFRQILLTYLPDYEYLERKTEKVSANQINKISKEFSGYITYSTVSTGKTIQVLQFSKGKLVKKIHPKTNTLPGKSDDASGSKATMGWIEVCYPIYYYPNCNEEGGGSSGGENDPGEGPGGDDDEGGCDLTPIYDGEECYLEHDGEEEPNPDECWDPEGFWTCELEEVTIDLNTAALCGVYSFKKVGSAYVGTVNGLGFTLTVRGASGYVYSSTTVTFGTSCITLLSSNAALASTKFVTAYNSAVTGTMYAVSSGAIANPNSTTLRSTFIGLMNYALGGGGTMGSGSCLGSDIPETNADFCGEE